MKANCVFCGELKIFETSFSKNIQTTKKPKKSHMLLKINNNISYPNNVNINKNQLKYHKKHKTKKINTQHCRGNNTIGILITKSRLSTDVESTATVAATHCSRFYRPARHARPTLYRNKTAAAGVSTNTYRPHILPCSIQ